MLGYPDRAQTRSEEALTLAEESSHIYTWFSPCKRYHILHQWRRELELVQERAEAMIALSRRAGVCASGWEEE